MGDKTAIEWTDASWTPIRARNLTTGKIGWHCEHATTGCEFCYAEGMNKRLGTGLPFKPGHRKDIEIFLDEEMLLAPLGWKKPRKIFVCSMTDAFADFVKDEWLDQMFAVMALCPQHTFQVLTKRAERMRDYMNAADVCWRMEQAARLIASGRRHGSLPAEEIVSNFLCGDPLPKVWIGVSCERQQEADERIPSLLQTPAAVRFISAEPLLGPIDLRSIKIPRTYGSYLFDALGANSRTHLNDPFSSRVDNTSLDWVIVGGESGPNARPCHIDAERSMRDQCMAAGVPFFRKQAGEWLHESQDSAMISDGRHPLHVWPDGTKSYRVGKKAAGRLLDGRTWDEFPEVSGPR